MKSHKDLMVWKKSIELVSQIYGCSREWPKEELYGLTNQVRRAAISVPSNIAEGAARGTGKDFARFLYIALGSLAEIETQIIIADRLGFPAASAKIEQDVSAIRGMLTGLIKSLQK